MDSINNTQAILPKKGPMLLKLARATSHGRISLKERPSTNRTKNDLSLLLRQDKSIKGMTDRPSIKLQRQRINESSIKLSEMTVPMASKDSILLNDKSNIKNQDDNLERRRSSAVSSGLSKVFVRAMANKKSEKEVRGISAQRTIKNPAVLSSIAFKYKDRTLERIPVTNKTLEALQAMLKEIDQVIRMFEEDDEVDQQEVYNKLQSLFFLGQKTEPYAIGFKTLELYFTVANLYKDFTKTVQLIKQYKSISTIYNDYTRKMDSYKWLALVYQDHQKTELAIMYLKKLYRLALAMGDRDRELLAYDLLGLQYYYLGDLEVAAYFHQKMANGEIEPEGSSYSKIAKSYFGMTLAIRTFEDNLQKEEAHKIYVSSGEEEIDIPMSNSKVANPKAKLPTLGLNSTQAKVDQDEKSYMQPIGNSKQGRSRSHGRLFFRRSSDPVEEQSTKVMSVEEFTRNVIMKKRQTVGSGRIMNPIRLNHMSTNRIAENLNHIQHSASNFKEDVIHCKYLDSSSKLKIVGLIRKFQVSVLSYIFDVQNTLPNN